MGMSPLYLSHWTFSSVPSNPPESPLKTLPEADHFDLCSSCSSTLEVSSEIKYSHELRL